MRVWLLLSGTTKINRFYFGRLKRNDYFCLSKRIKMYIVLSKTSAKTAIIKDKTELSSYINKAVSTIRRNLKSLKKWETKDFTIIKPDYVQIKSNSGGKREAKSKNDYF